MGKFQQKKSEIIKTLDAATGKDPVPEAKSSSAKSEKKEPKPQKEKTRDFSNDLSEVSMHIYCAVGLLCQN